MDGRLPEPFLAPIRATVDALVARVATVQKRACATGPEHVVPAMAEPTRPAIAWLSNGFRPLVGMTDSGSTVTPFPFPAISPALPEIVLVCAAMALLLVGVFRGEGSARLVAWLAVIVLLVMLVLCGVFGWERRLGFYGMFVTDAFALFMKALVLIGSAVSIMLALRFNEEHGIARFEFPVLVLLASTGMMVMVSANDLIALYVGLELQALRFMSSRASIAIRCDRAKPG